MAKIVIHEVERLQRGATPLWSDAEIEAMKRPLAREPKARYAYARLINRYCREQGIETTLEKFSPPSEVSLELIVRSPIIDRHLNSTRYASDLAPVSPDVSEARADDTTLPGYPLRRAWELRQPSEPRPS